MVLEVPAVATEVPAVVLDLPGSVDLLEVVAGLPEVAVADVDNKPWPKNIQEPY